MNFRIGRDKQRLKKYSVPVNRHLAVSLLTGFIVGLISLGSFNIQANAATEKIKVVASLEDVAAITRAVGGTKVDVFAIGKGYQNPHFIPPKPSFILKLRDADMLVQVGMGLEPWLQPLVDSSRNQKLFRGSPGFVDTSLGVPVLGIPAGRIDRSLGDVHGQGNPHYWLDPVNAKYISANIVNGLKRVDPQDSAYFDEQRQLFLKSLASHLSGWIKKGKPINGLNVVTYHQSWPYFANRFGLNVVGFIEPQPGIPPSAKYLAGLIPKLKAQNVKLILVEPYFNRQAADMVAHSIGATVVILPPSVGGLPGITDYFQLFDSQLDLLLKNL
jgi:zinc/manganese transport system substrate-binding protein